jgi:putative SOS response-associated peptidase YedK
MCYSVAFLEGNKAIIKRFAGINTTGIGLFTGSYHINGFIHPQLPIIKDNNPTSFELVTWGLIPIWAKDSNQAKEKQNFTLNARIETIQTKPSFKDVQHQHCIIPVNGFFEFFDYQKEKIPHYFYLKDQNIFSIAGIWSDWTNPENNNKMSSFSVITIENNQYFNFRGYPTHCDRFPFILPPNLEFDWLNPSTNQSELLNHSKEYAINHLKTHEVKNNLLKKGFNALNPETIKPYHPPHTGSLF